MPLDGHNISSAPTPPDNGELVLLPRNDAGNASRLVARHGHEMAWVREIGWLVWDGRRWSAEDGNESAYARAEMTAIAIYDEANEIPPPEPTSEAAVAAGAKRIDKRGAHRKWAVTSGNVSKCSSMLKAAENRLRRKQSDFDANPWLLNVQNGTLELAGKVVLRDHATSDCLTRLAAAAYDPAAECPEWRAFMDTVLPDPSTQLFVQKWLGYCLTGDISEQCFVMFDGKGSNGKSTMLESVARIIGDYAGNVPIESFLHQEGRKGSEASPDLARLPGVRLIRTSEPEQGARLSESRIKQWTGGEQVSARKLHRDFMDFTPSGKIMMSVNVRPHVVGKDEGTRTRILVVPFKHRFERRGKGRKPDYIQRFVANEAPGILNWLLDGFRLWWEDGLEVPTEVRLATDDMFAEQDPIGTSMQDLLIETGDDKDKLPASLLNEAYGLWSKRHGEEAKKPQAVGRRMKDLGYRKKHERIGTVYLGLQLNPDYLPSAIGGE